MIPRTTSVDPGRGDSRPGGPTSRARPDRPPDGPAGTARARPSGTCSGGRRPRAIRRGAVRGTSPSTGRDRPVRATPRHARWGAGSRPKPPSPAGRARRIGRAPPRREFPEPGEGGAHLQLVIGDRVAGAHRAPEPGEDQHAVVEPPARCCAERPDVERFVRDAGVPPDRGHRGRGTSGAVRLGDGRQCDTLLRAAARARPRCRASHARGRRAPRGDGRRGLRTSSRASTRARRRPAPCPRTAATGSAGGSGPRVRYRGSSPASRR